jgi:hypothetical protein
VRSRRSVVAILASLALLLGISAIMAWNLQYAPDESSHVFMVRHHAHSLDPATRQEMSLGALRGHPYFLLSPVPYAVHIPFQWLQEAVGPVDGAARPVYVITRFGGLPIAVAQFALTIAVVRRLFRRATPLQVILIATATNLLPQLRYLHAYVNPDALTVVAGTACFAVALRVLQRTRVGLADAALVGGTLAFAALMRLNIMVAAGMLLLAFAFRVVRQGGSIHERLRFLGVAVAIPVALSGSMYLAFYAELDNGSLLTATTSMEMGDSTFYGVIEPSPPMSRIIEVRIKETPTFWMSTWLWFSRYASLRGPPLRLLLVLCLVGVVGLAVPGGRLRRSGRVIGAAAVAAFVVTWASIASEWLYGQQGRFLLPAGVTALAVVITSTATLVDRIPRLRYGIVLAAATWAVLLLSLNVWGMTKI